MLTTRTPPHTETLHGYAILLIDMDGSRRYFSTISTVWFVTKREAAAKKSRVIRLRHPRYEARVVRVTLSVGPRESGR